MKGMIAMALFIVTFLLFIGVTFWFINAENSGARDADRKAEVSLSDIADLKIKVSNLKDSVDRADANYKQVLDLLSIGGIDSTKIKQKIEWMEMKLNAQAHHASTLPNKPIQISLVYRKAQAKAAAVTDQLPVKTEILKPGPGVLKSVKKKMSELSQ